MRVAYVILTCEKYLSTRVEWQMSTMFKNVDPNDLYFLGHKMDSEKRLFSWGAEDTYEQLPQKFIDFFRHSNLDYDWFILIDDDTYVFTDRLTEYLTQHRCHDSFAIGQLLDHIRDSYWGQYLSGGAGTIVSRMLYHQLRAYIQTYPQEITACHWCADIALGTWIKRVGGQMFHNPHFHADIYNPLYDNLEEALTFHHLKEWKDYDAMIHSKKIDNDNVTE
jgi:Fringe-like